MYIYISKLLQPKSTLDDVLQSTSQIHLNHLSHLPFLWSMITVFSWTMCASRPYCFTNKFSITIINYVEFKMPAMITARLFLKFIFASSISSKNVFKILSMIIKVNIYPHVYWKQSALTGKFVSTHVLSAIADYMTILLQKILNFKFIHRQVFHDCINPYKPKFRIFSQNIGPLFAIFGPCKNGTHIWEFLLKK